MSGDFILSIQKKTKLLLHKLSAEIITTARLQPNILDFFFQKKKKKEKKKKDCLRIAPVELPYGPCISITLTNPFLHSGNYSSEITV